MSVDNSFARTTFFITGGLLVWAADFLFIYVFAALACARGFVDVSVMGVGIVPFASAAATLVAASATAMLIAWAVRGRRRAGEARVFVVRAAFGAGVLALIAVLLTGLPGLLVTGTCG